MENWLGKRVLILGAARQGQALARFLSQQKASVILNDKRNNEQLSDTVKKLSAFGVEWILGDHPLTVLERVDIVCVSGGVPLDLPIILEAQKRKLPITNDSEIFMEEVKAPAIGITGSAGKTTTTTLVGKIAQKAILPPRKTWVGGNIGLPLVEYLSEIKPQDLVILELSSFQLEQMTISPHIAAILNITPNHLDRHGTMTSYIAAKTRILDFQNSNDIAILNREDSGSWDRRPQIKGRLLSFGMNKPLPSENGFFVDKNIISLQEESTVYPVMPVDLIRLRGLHNLYNVLAACTISHAAGLSFAAMNEAVKEFTGVEHRLELVRVRNGVTWINDTIATAPERTLAALNSISEPIVLLLGGRDKNLPWDILAKKIHQQVKQVVVFGEAAPKILAAIQQVKPGGVLREVHTASSFDEALHISERIACPGDVILLSPGCTSYDAFQDFEERGNYYKKWINQLP
jgi:UDP-N-acetylmuramoylalanine--D-glutamate ligase